jgi:hypothetical protein
VHGDVHHGVRLVFGFPMWRINAVVTQVPVFWQSLQNLRRWWQAAKSDTSRNTSCQFARLNWHRTALLLELVGGKVHVGRMMWWQSESETASLRLVLSDSGI